MSTTGPPWRIPKEKEKGRREVRKRSPQRRVETEVQQMGRIQPERDADEHCDDPARARSGAGRSSWSWPRSRGWGMRQWPALAGPGGRIRQGLAMEGEREAQGKPSGLRFERKVCETKQAGEVPECGVRRLGMGRIERSCLGPLGQSPRPSSFSPSLFLSPSHICRAMRNAGQRLMGSRFPLMITISRRWV